MGVVPACARRPRSKGVDERFAHWDDWLSLFSRSILESGQVQAVPMDEVRIAGVVDDLDLHGAPLVQPQHRTGDAAVVSRGFDRFAWCQLERNWTDADGVINCRFSGQCVAQPRRDARRAGSQQKSPSA
jgi:hypothetical protein